MRRLLLLLGIFATDDAASAVGIVPPIIRVDTGITPDTSQPDDDPLKLIERITRNARAVGDRLQKEDSGAQTQSTQEQLLKDIDSLLKPPPPMGGAGGGNSPPPPMGMGGGSAPPPTGEGGPEMNPMNSGSGGKSKRPRGGDMNEQQSGGQSSRQPMGGGVDQKKEPQGSTQPDPKSSPQGGESSGKPGQRGSGDGGKQSNPNLPLDDPFTRRVWGHLPEKLRQQAMQSYREQFMPRYSEMLKQYYSTLNEKQPPR
jgi:hypothetical protein